MNIENQLSDCVTNGQGVAVRRCCASCAMREIKKDGSRICSLMHITVKSRFKCRQWKMSDGLMNAGITKDSRRKEEKDGSNIDVVRQADGV